MTVIYSKKTGKIVSVWSGNNQSISSLYPNEDYSLVWDELTIEENIYLQQSPWLFRVDITANSPKIVVNSGIDQFIQ
ncbi:MAG: hypothetical protein Q8936_01380 [Bacillota bacterium]|nr:hypothetical protein [Bacillota bacterium]